MELRIQNQKIFFFRLGLLVSATRRVFKFWCPIHWRASYSSRYLMRRLCCVYTGSIFVSDPIVLKCPSSFFCRELNHNPLGTFYRCKTSESTANPGIIVPDKTDDIIDFLLSGRKATELTTSHPIPAHLVPFAFSTIRRQ